jgi:hypothetical protein
MTRRLSTADATPPPPHPTSQPAETRHGAGD